MEIFRPEEFIVQTATDDVLAGISIDRDATPSSFVIRGKIEPMPAQIEASDPLRINFHSPVPPWSDVDVMVDTNGGFGIYHEFRGLWVLTVMRGAEVLHVEPVFFAQKRQPASFVLKIGSKPLTVLRVQ